MHNQSFVSLVQSFFDSLHKTLLNKCNVYDIVCNLGRATINEAFK